MRQYELELDIVNSSHTKHNNLIKNYTNISKLSNENGSIQFQTKLGKLYLADSIVWLSSLKSESVDLVFADPPYNISKADWDNFESQEEYVKWSINWIKEASRVLKPTGSLYVCGFSEILADIKYMASKYFKSCRWLIWHYKNKANLGSDWGRSHESIIHFRKSKSFKLNIDDIRIPYSNHTLKYPTHPQAESSQYGKSTLKNKNNWIPHPQGAKPKDVIDIPTTCNGMEEKTPHPTQKPEELIRKFILSSSNEGDLVIDPFSGSGTTLVVAEQLNRFWMGCDLNKEYNEWAINRIKKIKKMTKEEWIELDKKNSKRRESIR